MVKIKVEDITKANVRNVSNGELAQLRNRCSQLYDKHFWGRDVQKSEDGIERAELIRKYLIVVHEMRERDLGRKRNHPIDYALFKSGMYGLDSAKLGDLVVVPDYVSIGGSFVKNPGEADDIDVVIRDEEGNRDEGLELKVGRLLERETGKEPHFVYAPKGPHSSYIPLFDAVLRSKGELRRMDVKEMKKGDREYYEGLEDWDDALEHDNKRVTKSLAAGSVLDVGCGSGKLLKILKNEGRKVQGVEVNKTALDMAKEKGVPMREHDLRKGIPFGSGTFDNVIAVHVVEHMDDPQSLLKEMARVSKRKAVALVPLGKRLDPSHRQEYKNIDDFRKALTDGWETSYVRKSNAALATLSKYTEKAKELKPFGKFDPPKPAMSGLTEAFSVDQIWDWAEGRELVAEPKLNGIRVVICKDGDRVKIMTENREDRSSKYPSLEKEVEKVPGDFILDASMGIERKGRPLPRIELMTLMADKPDLKEGDVIVCTVFDMPYLNEDLHGQPFSERRGRLETFFKKHLKGSKHFDISKSESVSGKADLERTFKKFAKLPQSEGVVVKDVKSKWDLDGSAQGWAKLKVEAEVKVMVIKEHSVKGGKHNYTCGVLKGDSDFKNITRVGDMELVNLGKTYNTEVSASPGDILTVAVEEVIPNEDKNELDWLGARVVDKDEDRKEPYYANQMIDVAEKANVLQKKAGNNEEGAASVEGNIDFEEGDRGDAVAQIHIMGIEEKELADLKGIQGQAKAARTDLKKLEKLLKDTIGEQGAHVDVRFHRKGDKYWEGGEIMIGNLSGLEKLYNYKKGDYLRFGWKVPRKGEAKIKIIRGPMGWIEAGANKLEVFEPGEVGATENMYGTLLRIDKFNWELYKADEHAKKFHITGSRFFNGNWLFSYVPVTEQGKKGKRVWMMSKLDDDDHEKDETEKLDLEQFRSSGVDEDLKNPGKRWEELFADLRYLGNSGYPKLKAGESWGEWKMDDLLRYYAKIVDALRSVYFPVLPPKVGDDNYKTSYWEAYREAKKHMKSKPPSEKEAPEWEERREKLLKMEDAFFKIVKRDRKKQIVGGIVYEPDTEDTQGDVASAREIEDSMYRFMERYAKNQNRINVNHKGRTYAFPILESFIPEQGTRKGNETIKKGAWWLMVKVTDDEIWDLIESGKLQGFSMEGTARKDEN